MSNGGSKIQGMLPFDFYGLSIINLDKVLHVIKSSYLALTHKAPLIEGTLGLKLDIKCALLLQISHFMSHGCFSLIKSVVLLYGLISKRWFI